MNIILKESIKNIFGKPLRTLLVIFSIFVCSICALLSFDLVSSIKDLVGNLYGVISSGDIIAIVSEYSIKGLPDGFPKSEIMGINSNSEPFYKDIDGEYAFVTAERLTIYGIDMDEAVNMGFIDRMEIGDNEAVITYKFSKDFGYGEGDTLIVHDREGEEVELKIVGVLEREQKNVLLTGYKSLVNTKTANIISCGRGDVGVLFIDISDDILIDDAVKQLEDYYPNGTIIKMAIDADDMEDIAELEYALYLVFAVTFLLVIFVTASICNRIVSERMSFIGTLRSLGMSTARTGRILLLENVLYGLLGSVPAIFVYALLRNPLFGMLFYTTDSEGNRMAMYVDPISPLLIAGVIIGSIAIECLIPLRALLKALNTSIRDIIFDNRDTEYKYSKTGLIFGLVLLAGGIVAFFFRKQLPGATTCLVCIVVALACLFPWVFKGVVTLLGKLAAKNDNAKWTLALAEAKSRKSTVGSGVLCVTAAAMSVVIFTMAQSAMNMFSGYDYSSDVIVSCNGRLKNLSFIDRLDGVTVTEVIFNYIMTIRLNDEEKDAVGDFYAMSEKGFKYYNVFQDIPEALDEGSIIVDTKYAEAHNILAGDVIKLLYNPDGVVPVEREYKVAALVKINSFDGKTGTFIITPEEYKELFSDNPGYYLIKCDDPDKVAELIRTYAVGSITDAVTMTEYIEESKREENQLTTIMAVIIAVALGMTFIGMASNQLLGFEGRKKECAVMISTSMNKGKLSGILTLEMLITSITASVMGTLAGVFLAKVIGDATRNSSSIFLVIETDPVKSILFCLLLILIFTGTVLFPIRNLRKMKISEQLKYE